MKVINVPASKHYDVLIERGILDSAGELISAVSRAKRAAIVTDDKVGPLYGERVAESLRKSGFETMVFTFPNGESSKNIVTYGKILNFLAENKLTRTDLLVALGGGVVGDLTGFAAATYLRGVSYVQIPTTVLAAVDSSVGGKTAVDLDCGKNLAGAFYQPSLVICDPDMFDTLDEEVYRDGCAEVIKYGLLGDRDFFKSLYETPVSEQAESVIARCVEMKRDIVAEDEFDTGRRQLLNLGHTFGHAIEALSNYTMGHGTCVAIGMAMMAQAAKKFGYCDGCAADAVDDILKAYGLPSGCPYGAAEMVEAALSDKKNYGGVMRIIVPYAVGDSRIVEITADKLYDWLKAGGAK